LPPASSAPAPSKEVCSATTRGGGSCASFDSALLQVHAVRAKLRSEPGGGGEPIRAGDTVYLVSHIGRPMTVQEDGRVHAEWGHRGVWERLVVELADGGGVDQTIRSNASVFLRAWTGKRVTVEGTAVHAHENHTGASQRFVIEREAGSGDVLDGDAVFLRSWTGKHLDVNGPFPVGGVQARWDDHGSWQRLIIERAATPAATSETAMPELLHAGSHVQLKSWKGDYLHKLDGEGVTTWGAGVGNEWTVEVVDANVIKLKSWKGDYLHKPDGEGVTTWGAGVGSEWTVEVVNGSVIKLKSWKGDYLHKPDGEGVTTWGAGMGNEWTVEPVQP